MTSLVFPLIVNMAGIPVISIIIRYNLEKTESADGSNDSNEWGLSKSSSVFIAHILPWILLVPFNTQSGMNVRSSTTFTLRTECVSRIAIAASCDCRRPRHECAWACGRDALVYTLN